MAKPNKETLADKIANVLSAAPLNIDDEDTVIDNTEAKILENTNEEDETEEQLLSKFRKENLDLLADVDERYAGKTSSRKRLRESSSSEEESEQEEIQASESENGENDESNESVESGESDDGSGYSDYSDAEFGDDRLGLSSENDNFKHLKEPDGSESIKKAVSVRNQMKRYEKMLEMRINLQKCLKAANCMPDKNILKELQTQSEFNKSYSQTRDKLLYTLDRLLLLQKMSFDHCPDLKKSLKSQNSEDVEEDEEIPSDTEEEEVVDEEPEKKKRRTLLNYEKELQQRHNDYSSYRNNVIKTWNDKTRLAVAKSGSASHSVLDQIDYTLKDKARLIKRTQLKRSDYKILGISPNNNNNDDDEYNNEIFDDDDFYHQQLRELIEFKSADITDPVQLGRQWIQLQNMRSKMKRNVDTRATKGRKIRYAVHSKLVNFMAPIEENSWTDEAKNELYNSIFGKTAS